MRGLLRLNKSRHLIEKKITHFKLLLHPRTQQQCLLIWWRCSRLIWVMRALPSN